MDVVDIAALGDCDAMTCVMNCSEASPLWKEGSLSVPLEEPISDLHKVHLAGVLRTLGQKTVVGMI